MAWVLYVVVAMALPLLCAGQDPLYEEKSLSMSGFHLCTKNETRNVSVLVVHTVAHKEEKPCGGLLMWLKCTVTLYKMIHQTEYREVKRQVTQCCDGYEKVGRYCALSVKGSDVLAAKPGSCPRAHGFNPTSEDSGTVCEWDIDCPGWQKCCPTSNTSVCTDSDSVSNAGRYRFNVTITVKTDYPELLIKNGSLLNHTMILQAMMTGVLQMDLMVYYLASWPVHPYRTATSFLIDSSSALSLHRVESKLVLLLKRIQEVTSMRVDDVNECAYTSLRHCSPQAECNNTIGSYRCACTMGYLDADPINTGANCTAPTFTNVEVANITGTSFCVYWSTNSRVNQSFRVTVHTGSDAVAVQDTNNTMVKLEELKPAMVYNVSVVLNLNGDLIHTVHVRVKTDGLTVDATTRLTNIQFTDDLMDSSSEAFRNLSDSIREEIYQAHEIEALVNLSQLRVEIKSFSTGSVLVHFFIIWTSGSQDITNASKVVFDSLTNSSKFTVDEDSSGITDFDECASGDHDCSQKADCINSWASYTCVCQDGFTDINTQRPGRTCQASLGTTTSLPSLFTVSQSNPAFYPSITTQSSASSSAPTLTFSAVTTNVPKSHVPFSLSEATAPISTALARSTASHSSTTLTTLNFSTSPTSSTTRSRPSEHTSLTTVPSLSTATGPGSTSTIASSSSGAPATFMTPASSLTTLLTAPFIMTTTPTAQPSASVVPTTHSNPTAQSTSTHPTLPTASLSRTTRISSSTAKLFSTSAPTSIFTLHTTPSTTQRNPSGAHLIQSTVTAIPLTTLTASSTTATTTS